MTTYRCGGCGKDVETEDKELMAIDPFDPLLIEVSLCEACVGAAEEAVREESHDKGYQEGWQAGYDTATEEWEEKAEEEEEYGEDTPIKEDTKDERY